MRVGVNRRQRGVRIMRIQVARLEAVKAVVDLIAQASAAGWDFDPEPTRSEGGHDQEGTFVQVR